MITITDIASVPRDGDRDPRVRALQESATNMGSLLLWGSSAYPRMDRADAVRGGYIPRAADPRMLAVGVIDDEAAAISMSRDPQTGVRLYTIINLDGSVA